MADSEKRSRDFLLFFSHGAENLSGFGAGWANGGYFVFTHEEAKNWNLHSGLAVGSALDSEGGEAVSVAVGDGVTVNFHAGIIADLGQRSIPFVRLFFFIFSIKKLDKPRKV
ncbi:hypothetical protein N9955_00575 [bacterium]|nr:hypothetical protein [bacterium]